MAGESYIYRIRGIISGVEIISSPVTVSPPVASLTLDSVRPNPLTRGDLRVSFTLPELAPARLELIDVAGRVVESRAVDVLGVGAHTVALQRAAGLPPGIHFVRLVQGGRTLVTRFAVVR